MPINLNEATDRYFMSPGCHQVCIQDCREESLADGRKCWRFTLLNGDEERCYHSIVLTQKTVPVLRSLARACGMTREERNAVEPGSFIDKRIEIDVDHNEEGFPVVRRWRPAEGEEDTSEKSVTPEEKGLF